MDIVEDALIMQADEVGTADIVGQLYNFMPDLVILSALHLMRDPRLALPGRLETLQASASALGVVTVCILSSPSHVLRDTQDHCDQQCSQRLCAHSDHILAYDIRHTHEFFVDGIQRTVDWLGHRIPPNVCEDSRMFRLRRQPLKQQESESKPGRGGDRQDQLLTTVLFLEHTCITPAVKAAVSRFQALLAGPLLTVAEVGGCCALIVCARC